jgi:3'(2'), 5'-bisphosphate nucleotidase
MQELAIRASIAAGKAILRVYEESVAIEVETKSDNSPLTQADTRSNDIINSFLRETGIPIISEENRQTNYHTRKQWEECWIVDPLDGTKEFIKKNGEFTVNIALCEKGSPIFGVIYVPVSRELYYGDVANSKSYKTVLNEAHIASDGFFQEADRIHPAPENEEVLRVVGSRSHMNAETEAFIESERPNYKNV